MAAYVTPKENMRKKNLYNSTMFPAHGKMTKIVREIVIMCCFATNADPANILGRTDFYFENVYF